MPPEDGDIDQLIRRRREVSEDALRYEPPGMGFDKGYTRLTIMYR